MTVISSQEIRQKAGIKATKTLTRWHQRGLIPPPVVKTHPNGRGKMAYWPGWVLHRVHAIRRLLSDGLGRDEIAEKLGSDWEAEEKRYPRRRRTLKQGMENEKRRDAREKFAEAVSTRVYEFLKAMGVQRPGIGGRLDELFANLPLVKSAIGLTQDGFNAVAVVTGKEIYVTTDFVLGRSLVDDQTAPLLIVPLGDVIREAFSEIEKDLPQKPSRVASKVVDEMTSADTVHTEFSVGKNWTFALTEDGERKRSTRRK